MNRNARVSFEVEPRLEFTSKEIYPGIGVTPEFEENRLKALSVDINVDSSDDEQEVIDLACQKLTPLLERLRYLTGVNVNVQPTGIESGGKRLGIKQATADVLVVHESRPMPTEHEIRDQDAETTYQLICCNRAKRASDFAQRIRDYYLVMEAEQGITECGSKYNVPEELRYTRHAVSHSVLSDPNVKAFLKPRIGFDRVDYSNSSHLKFLRIQAEKLREEAERILNAKM
jgi:hypothetical protein